MREMPPLLVLALGLLAGPSAAGPVTFTTALPVHVGEWIVRQQTIWLRATDDPGPPGRSVNALVAPTVVVYGLDRRTALFAIQPFVSKQLEMTTPAGRVTRAATGLGDLTVLARWTAVAIDRPGETIRLAPLAGIKLPTGATDRADGLGRLPEALQPGSGSWDPLLGSALTWQKLRWELDAAASYQRRSRAHGFRAGDEGRGEVSFQYRVLPYGRRSGRAATGGPEPKRSRPARGLHRAAEPSGELLTSRLKGGCACSSSEDSSRSCRFWRS